MNKLNNKTIKKKKKKCNKGKKCGLTCIPKKKKCHLNKKYNSKKYRNFLNFNKIRSNKYENKKKILTSCSNISNCDNGEICFHSTCTEPESSYIPDFKTNAW